MLTVQDNLKEEKREGSLLNTSDCHQCKMDLTKSHFFNCSGFLLAFLITTRIKIQGITTNCPLKLKTILKPYDFRKHISSDFNWERKSFASLSWCYILERQNFWFFQF